MFTIYVISAVLGGGLILLGALGGLHHGLMDGWDSDAHFDFDHAGLSGGPDFDHSLEAEHDFDHEVDHDMDHSSESGAHHTLGEVAVHSTFWLPFFSLRFWIYAIGGFGVLGTIFTLFSLAPASATLIWSIAFGVVLGSIVATTMRALKMQESSHLVGVRDYIGVMATLTVVPRNGEPGKVRMSVKGETIDMLALPDQKILSQGVDLTKGEEVVIVGVEGTKVRVARMNDFMQD